MASSCLNCGAPLNGGFCAACGQRDIPSYPSMRELATDAFEELSGWDGRIASTFKTLLRQPGQLTKEFLEGRRARYISPLRLYLMASLAYFVLAASAPEVKLKSSGKTVFMGMHFGVQQRDSGTVRQSADVVPGQPVSAAARATIMESINETPAFMRPILRRSIDDPEGVKRDIYKTLPRVMFVLLPIFAVIVGFFYRHKKYTEHLYFSIHLHAFLFLALALVELLKFTTVAPLVLVVTFAVLLSIPIYAGFALRRLYGGGVARTIAKEAGIGISYLFAYGAAYVAMLTWMSVGV